MEKCNVLALSGGGYRGLFTVRVLRKLEETIGKPISEHFDIITGTSIGGIIALGIAAGISLKEIEQLFIEKGSSIFPNPIYGSKIKAVKALFSPIHSASGLKKVLNGLFKNKTMKELTKAFVIVPAANLTTGKPKMFKTPHCEDLFLDADLKVSDVALATSAAPVYFPIHKIEQSKTRFSDGGLVGNAPGLFGWLEAEEYLNVNRENISVLSVGTLGGAPNVSSKTDVDQGASFWLNPMNPRLLKFLMSQQEYLAHFMLGRLLGKRYQIIDTTISEDSASDIDLDDTSQAAQETLIARAESEFSMFLRTDFYKEQIKSSPKR
jgi:patatin-like phospholipase/acyl hydrolase